MRSSYQSPQNKIWQETGSIHSSGRVGRGGEGKGRGRGREVGREEGGRDGVGKVGEGYDQSLIRNSDLICNKRDQSTLRGVLTILHMHKSSNFSQLPTYNTPTHCQTIVL